MGTPDFGASVDATHLWRCEACQDEHARWVCPACHRPNMDWAYWSGEKVECNGCGATFLVVLGDDTNSCAPQERETQ